MEKNNSESLQGIVGETAPESNVVGGIGIEPTPTTDLMRVEASDLPEVPIIDPAAVIKAGLGSEMIGSQAPDVSMIINNAGALQRAFEGAATTEAGIVRRAVNKLVELKKSGR